MADQLQQAISRIDVTSVNIVTAEHWHEYQQGLRAGRPGIYLAPPHFAAWAIHQHQFKALIRLSSPLSYVIAARRNDANVFEMNDLAKLPVCARKPLNLDYLLINNAFDNTLLSADIMVVPSVIKEMRRSTSDCRGFSLSNTQFEQLALTFPDRYIRLQQSMKFNNLVMLSDAGSWVKHGDRIDRIKTYLVTEQGREVLAPMLGEMALSATWISARSSDYPAKYYQSLAPFWE